MLMLNQQNNFRIHENQQIVFRPMENRKTLTKEKRIEFSFFSEEEVTIELL